MKRPAALGACVAICVVLLSGCHVGPNIIRPLFPLRRLLRSPRPPRTNRRCPAPGSPRSPQDAVLKGKWWEMFNEPELNALEDQLDINNQNIAQYFQNFMAARAQVSEARAPYFPTVTANPARHENRDGRRIAGSAVAQHWRNRNRHHRRRVHHLYRHFAADRRLLGAGPVGPRSQHSSRVSIRRPGERRGSGKRAPHRAGRPGRISISNCAGKMRCRICITAPSQADQESLEPHARSAGDRHRQSGRRRRRPR